MLVIIALVGCNDLLGLDATATDTDGDGIVDAIDNCPLDPNPNQLDGNHDGIGNVCQCILIGEDRDGDGIDDGCDDCIGPGALHVDTGGDGIDDGCEPCPAATGTDVDGDGIDDACDDCVLGSPHDEDGDGIADACDNCPVDANPDQAAVGDGDAVGDACDYDESSPQGGRAFDSFEVEDPTLWTGDVPGWTWLDDALVVDGSLSTDPHRWSSIRVDNANWVETRVTVDPNGGDASLVVRDVSVTFTCDVDSGRNIALVFSPLHGLAQIFPGGVVPGTGPIRLRITTLVPSSASSSVECDGFDASGAASAPATMLDQVASGRVGLVAGLGTTRFDYLWAAWQP